MPALYLENQANLNKKTVETLTWERPTVGTTVGTM